MPVGHPVIYGAVPHRDPEQLDHARANRRHPTWDELRLWQALRKRRLGYRFRRQEPIGSYIADFVCRTRKLIVEADGFTHFQDPDTGRDPDDTMESRRDAYLVARGYQVHHFLSDFIQVDLGGVLDIIATHLESGSPGAYYWYE